jgi:hypothetical protein
VTPFELSDSSGHWHNFDWVYPTPPYAPHLQYERVTALAKPDGGLEPYGFQIIFKASVDPSVTPFTYTSQLAGSERSGSTAFDPAAAPVEVKATGFSHVIYLPIIFGPTRTDGPWYLSVPETDSAGAIVPSHYLQAGEPAQAGALAAAPEFTNLSLAGEPQAMAIDEEAGLGGIILADGRLEIIDLVDWQSKDTIFVGPNPQAMAAYGPGSASVYVSLEDGLALVDLQSGQIVRDWSGLGRWRGLARDSRTHRLFAVDAENERLAVFKEDLSQLLVELPLDGQPDQLIFDPTEGQIYLSLPATPEVIAIDADQLVVTARAHLTGGPVLDLIMDGASKRLYALNLLSPTYRGITVLNTPDLGRRALVGGVGDFPLQGATTIALTGDGQLLVPETNGLWQISPDQFKVSNIEPGQNLSSVGEVVVRRSDNRVIMLEPLQKMLKVLQ